MHRRSLLGRFAETSTAVSPAERPQYFRTVLEPLEARQLLSVSTLNWAIDTVNSNVTLAIPDQAGSLSFGGNLYHTTFRARDQSGSGSAGTWATGNTAALSGTLAIDYVDGSQLQFKTGLNNFGEVDATSWRPDPGTSSPNPAYDPSHPDVGTSSYPLLYSNFTYTPNTHDGSGTFLTNTAAPAAFGTRLNGTVTYPIVVFGLTVNTPVTADVGYLSLSHFVDDVASGVLPISSGSFAVNTTNLGTSGAQVGLQGLSIAGLGTPTSYLNSGQVLTTAGINFASPGTITTTGTLTRKLTLPILSLAVNLSGEGIPLTGTMSGQIVANVTLTAPTVDLNGSDPGTGFTTTWSNSGPVKIGGTLSQSPRLASDTLNMAASGGVTASLAAFHTGDVLAANTSGTSIAATYSGGTLTLSGTDTTAHYEQVLQTITYDNTLGNPGVPTVTVKVVATDAVNLTSSEADSLITTPGPSLSLTAGAGSGAPNFTTTWYNQGSIPIENNVLATVGTLSGIPTLQSLTVKLATFHTGDVLSVPILTNVSISSSYAAGTLTLSGSDTLAHYQQELRFINYNNTAGGPGAGPITATFVANDGTQTSLPVTSTINISVGSGQVLGNRLFYNNSKYDGNNGAINASDDAAIASDKTGYSGTGTATFANVSAFSRGITGIMVDLASGIGTHAAISLTSGDISFKVSPASFVTTTYNQLSTWSAAPSPAAISVRMGAGQGGSDRLEITFATGAIKNEWIEVDVHAGGNTGLSADDVFYFGSAAGNSGAADTVALSKVDGNDYTAALNNIMGLTTPVWNLADFTKDGKVDMTDVLVPINGVFSLHYLANPTGPFGPSGGGGLAVPAAVSAAMSAVPSSTPPNVPSWIGGRLQSILTIPSISKSLPSALPTGPLVQAVDQGPAKLQVAEDAIECLLADLGLK